MKKTIAILFGGCSPEYPVSLQSAYSVVTHLDTSLYRPVLIGITRAGDWYAYSGPLDKLPEDTWAEDESCCPVTLSMNRRDHGFLLLHSASADSPSIKSMPSVTTSPDVVSADTVNASPDTVSPDAASADTVDASPDTVSPDAASADTVDASPGTISPDAASADTVDASPDTVSPDASPEISCSDNASIIRVDAIFPVLHGKNGEDGTVQGACELAGIPVVGCQVLSSALCMHKELAHRIVESIGIRVPKCFTFTKDDDLENVQLTLAGLSYPLFVKPMKAGSSFGITKVSDEEHLEEAISLALRYDTHVIVEETIDGFEVGCAVLEDNGILLTGRVDEIELSSGFFDYTEKYTLKSSKIHLPARIPTAVEEQVKTCALKIYRALDCRGFARVDMFLTKAGGIVFNEVNTIPGFTAHSRYPGMLKEAGIRYDQILNILLRQVISYDQSADS